MDAPLGESRAGGREGFDAPSVHQVGHAEAMVDASVVVEIGSVSIAAAAAAAYGTRLLISAGSWYGGVPDAPAVEMTTEIR